MGLGRHSLCCFYYFLDNFSAAVRRICYVFFQFASRVAAEISLITSQFAIKTFFSCKCGCKRDFFLVAIEIFFELQAGQVWL